MLTLYSTLYRGYYSNAQVLYMTLHVYTTVAVTINQCCTEILCYKIKVYGLQSKISGSHIPYIGETLNPIRQVPQNV